MNLFDAKLTDRRKWLRLGDVYEITQKPRGLDIFSLATVPFVPMASIPQGGAYAPDFILKAPTEIKSGTYFERGDILIAKITPSFENGKQALATGLPTPIGFATTEVIPLRPRNNGHDQRLLFFYLLHPDVRHHIANRMEGTTGRQRVPKEVLLDLPFPEFDPEEQTTISDLLEMIQRLIIIEIKSEQTAVALKNAAMSTLFTRGLRGEAQKETEIGLMPESWEILSVAESVRPFRFERTQQVPKSEYAENGRWPIIDQGQDFIGGYVDDETRLINSAAPIIIFGDHTRIFKFVDFEFALGAQGTKPLLAEDGFNSKYLYYALCNLDVPPRGYNRHYKILSQMHIGKPDPSEQREIVTILDTIDRKIDLHRRKRAVLDDLFKSLLHKLMTGEIRVGDLVLTNKENSS